MSEFYGKSKDASRDLRSEAQKAADYARSLGYCKAADYVERNYDGGKFVPGEAIRVKTRNMGLEGQQNDTGVRFERQAAQLGEDLSVEGVFPVFDSNHHVELGEKARDMSLHKQFSACRDDFWDHMYDNPDKMKDITIGQMEKLEKPGGYAPEGFTWHHNPAAGSYELVKTQQHLESAHTGGNSFWGCEW